MFIFIPWLTFHSQRNIYLWLAPFNIPVIFIWINYYLGCTTKPGSVKKYNAPKGFKPRWCKICLNFKPPRAHHCRVCQSCVLKMDHHCPWLNNCIGYYNHAHFVRFCTSVTVGSLSCLCLIGLRIWDVIRYQNVMNSYQPYNNAFDYYTPPVTLTEITLMLINIIVLFFLLLSVGGLSVYQLYYASQNITTIESFELENIQEMKEKNSEIEFEFPFHLGMYKNFQSLFGENPLFWWVPKKMESGDGMHYKTKDGMSMEWPPKQYYLLRRFPHLSSDILKKSKDSKDSQDLDDMDDIQFHSHVRKGSEGYIVREWTLEERQQAECIKDKGQNVKQKPKPLITFDSDFDSLDDTDPDEHVNEFQEDYDDGCLDSDDEILGLKKYN